MNYTILAMYLLSMFIGNCISYIADTTYQSTGVDRFRISILREDGLLVPFAEYRDGRWLAPWPNPDPNSKETENSLTDMQSAWFDSEKRQPTTWYFRRSDGVVSVLETSKTMKAQNHCQDNWVMLSNFPGKALKEGEHHTNIGVALDVDKVVDRPIDLTNIPLERRRFTSLIQPAFDKAEGLELSEINSKGYAVYTPPIAERKKVKLTLNKLYRNKLAIAGQFIYYLEAKKEYKKPVSSYDPSCNNISFFKGWILQNKRGDLKLIDKQFIFTDCDMKIAAVTKLLGILPIGDRIFIIIEDHGYEDESYSILELKGARIKHAIKVWGGAC